MSKIIYGLLFIIDVVLTPIVVPVVYIAMLLYMLYNTIRYKEAIGIKFFMDFNKMYFKMIIRNLENGLNEHKKRLVEAK